MLAKTPPMGWNSWNTFGPNINEKVIMETADAMADDGYLEAGYEYLVIDDGWQLQQRDDNGRMVPDPEKFPHGIKYVADYVHKKGLKFGIYSAAGTLSCLGLAGSFGHEYEDAKTFAEWGVDYLKYDLCHFPGGGDAKTAYMTMSMALRACGREIMICGCIVGEHDPHSWMRSVGIHMYRSTGDISDNFESIRNNSISQLRRLYAHAPGCYNDVDMLVVGMGGKGNVSHSGGCTPNEYLIHFILWCLYGAPLMMGCDLRNLAPEYKEILLNKTLIAIDQDEECRPPYYNDRQRYAYDVRLSMIKLLSDNRLVVAFFNFDDSEHWTPFYLSDYGIPGGQGKSLKLTDALTGEDCGIIHDAINPTLPPRSFRLYFAEVV